MELYTEYSGLNVGGRWSGMTDTSRRQLNWSIPTTDWEQFKENVARKRGPQLYYLQSELENAVEEYLDKDGLGPVVEERARRLTDADAKEKPLSRDTEDDHVTVSLSIYAPYIEAMRREADEMDCYCWQVLTAGVREYNAGGRMQRIANTLSKVAVDDLAVRDTEAESTDTATAIVERLEDGFTLDDFTAAAKAEGVTTGDYAIRRYLPTILDTTGAVPHPAKPELFVRPDSTSALEYPNPAHLPYYAQTDKDKRVGIQVAAVRKAWSNNGRAKLTVREGVDVLAGVGSPRYKTIRQAMRAAERDDGFRFDGDNEGALKVDQSRLDGDHPAVTIAAEKRRWERETDSNVETEAEDGGSLGRTPGKAAEGPTSTTLENGVTDAVGGTGDDDADTRAEVDAEMERLVAATAVTAGGQEEEQ